MPMSPLLSLALAAAAAAPAPVAHSWQFVGASHEAAQFVDDRSLVVDCSTRRAWIIGIPDPQSDVARAQPGAYTMSAHVFDCRLRTQAIVKMNIYDASDELVAEKADVYPVQPIAPGSAGEQIAAYVCDGEVHTDHVAKLTSLSDVKSVGVNWQSILDQAEKLAEPR